MVELHSYLFIGWTILFPLSVIYLHVKNFHSFTGFTYGMVKFRPLHITKSPLKSSFQVLQSHYGYISPNEIVTLIPFRAACYWLGAASSVGRLYRTYQRIFSKTCNWLCWKKFIRVCSMTVSVGARKEGFVMRFQYFISFVKRLINISVLLSLKFLSVNNPLIVISWKYGYSITASSILGAVNSFLAFKAQPSLRCLCNAHNPHRLLDHGHCLSMQTSFGTFFCLLSIFLNYIG